MESHVGDPVAPHVVGEPPAAVVGGHQDPVRPTVVPDRAVDLEDREHEVAAADLGLAVAQAELEGGLTQDLFVVVAEHADLPLARSRLGS